MEFRLCNELTSGGNHYEHDLLIRHLARAIIRLSSTFYQSSSSLVYFIYVDRIRLEVEPVFSWQLILLIIL